MNKDMQIGEIYYDPESPFMLNEWSATITNIVGDIIYYVDSFGENQDDDITIFMAMYPIKK
jgi:hypothetical protein